MKQFFTLLMLLVASVSFAQVKEITSLSEVPNNGRPYVIKAYADWCGPCRYYTPIFHEASEKFAGKVDFYMINIDNEKAKPFCRKFNIQAIPETIIFRSSETFDNLTGAQSLDDLVEKITEVTGVKPAK